MSGAYSDAKHRPSVERAAHEFPVQILGSESGCVSIADFNLDYRLNRPGFSGFQKFLSHSHRALARWQERERESTAENRFNGFPMSSHGNR